MPSAEPRTHTHTHLHDLPEPLLLHIFSLLAPTRARNAAALTCRRWLYLERHTRSHLSLRGNPFTLPFPPLPFPSFPSLTSLDLSLLSPWGHPFHPGPLVGPTLALSFPRVASLTLYHRDPTALAHLAPCWTGLKRVKLVRWHNRPNGLTIGSDLEPLFVNCTEIESIDLSEFYCWTEDVPHAVQSYPAVARSITSLDLMLASATDGFRASEILSVSSACPNLRHLVAPCVFNPRYMDFMNDATLQTLAVNCPCLVSLHLLEPSSAAPTTANPNQPPSAITPSGLDSFLSSLPCLTDLTLDLQHDVPDAGPALEYLGKRSAGPAIRSLKLGHFQGICRAAWLHLDGVAVCGGLKSLCIKNCADLTDAGLAAIARGCTVLNKIELYRCDLITERGIRRLVKGLSRTLLDVGLHECALVNAAVAVRALDPVCGRLERLHLDCAWARKDVPDGEVAKHDDDDGSDDCDGDDGDDVADDEPAGKRCKYTMRTDADIAGATNGGCSHWYKRWDALCELSLWLPAGELLTPLSDIGLDSCPNLEEITIKVEGDCRMCPKPSQRVFGLSTLARFSKLTRMKLDLGEAIGYALTAPTGQMDLSLWERFYLHGIGDLSTLQEFDYWPPQDKEVNQRTLSLPAAGLIQGCLGLRKLFIHGTAHEHFMRFFLLMPNLRDVQLREDYYPAPENDMSTEMRVDSCGRFELALNSRVVPN